MVPQDPAGWILFFAFVAPGALFDLVVRTRRPLPSDTALSELSRVILVSVLAMALAILVPGGIARLFGGEWLTGLEGVLVGQSGPQAQPSSAVVGDGLALLLTSLVIAVALAWLLIKVAPDAKRYDESQWRLVFRRKRPPNTHVHVVAVTEAGVRYFGRLVAFSDEGGDPTKREITLGGRLFRQESDGGQLQALGAQRLVLAGERCSELLVSYTAETGAPGARGKRRAGDGDSDVGRCRG